MTDTMIEADGLVKSYGHTRALAGVSFSAPPGSVLSADRLRLGAAVDSAPGLATALVRALDQAGMLVDNIEVRQPSLDDVFFALTGAHIPGDNNGSSAAKTSARPGGPGADAAERESEGAQA